MNDGRYIVLCPTLGSINLTKNVTLLDLLVLLEVIGLGPIEQRTHSDLLTVITEPERIPLRNAFARIELLRPTTELFKFIIQLRMNVLETHAHLNPRIVIRGTMLS